MICKFLCVPFLIKAQGNEFHFADSLYSAKNYALAAVEYERVAFENASPFIKTKALVDKANSLKMSGAYAEAAETLDDINLSNLNDSVQYAILFASALNAYLAHQPNEAFSKLENICYFHPDSAAKQDVLLMKILSLNEMQRWKEADTIFRQFITKYNQNGGPITNPYLSIPKMKDPDKAEKLSAYLPFTGAGLFYAGSVKEGLLSILLQVGFISFGAYSVLMERYITGVLIGVGGYAAFYKGGVRRARSLTEINNKKKTIAFNTQVRNVLTEVIKNRIH